LKGTKIEFYTGSCNSIENRLEDHITKSVKTTKKFDKIKLVYYEACISKIDARKRELQLKTGFGRGYIKRRLMNFLNNMRA
jgi:putative endonuclease